MLSASSMLKVQCFRLKVQPKRAAPASAAVPAPAAAQVPGALCAPSAADSLDGLD